MNAMNLTDYINLTDYTVNQQILFFLDAIFWMVAYFLVIRKARKNKYLGIPVAAVIANIAWEFVWSFMFRTELGELYVWGIRAWFVIDIAIVYYLFKYGHKQVQHPLIRKNFKLVAALGILIWGLIIYAFTEQYGDPIGAGTGYILNIIMSALFIFLFMIDPKEKTLSVSVAVWKMFGTGFVGLSIFMGQETQTFVVIIGLLTFLLDLVYITLLLNRKRIIAARDAAAQPQEEETEDKRELTYA